MDYKQLLTLNIENIKTPFDLTLFIAPFFNEFANLFTLTVFLPYLRLNLYPEHPKNDNELYIKSIIDVIALSGIIGNSAYTTLKTGNFVLGFLKGFLYLIFAFMIPNLFMERILHIVPNGNIARLLLGFFVIYLLELSILTIHSHYSSNVDYNSHAKSKSNKNE